MKANQYKEDQTLFITGIVCLVLCLGLLFFGVYILPFLLWDTNYGVPFFVSDMIAYFQNAFYYTSAGSKFVVDMLFIIPGLIFGIASYFISNYIENKIYIEKPPEEEQSKDTGVVRREIKASAGVGLKIFLLMAVVVVVLIILQSMLFGN